MVIPPNRIIGFEAGFDPVDPRSLAEPLTPEVVVMDAGCVWPGIRDRWVACLVRATADAELDVAYGEALDWVNDAPRDRISRALSRHTHLGPEVLQPLLKAVWQDFEDLAAHEAGLAGDQDVALGAAEALAALQAEGCRVLIEGPVPRRHLEEQMMRLGWDRTGLVDGCLGTEDGAASGTPSSAVALEHLGLRPLGSVARVVASASAANRATGGDYFRVIWLGGPVLPPPGEYHGPALVAVNFGEMLAALLARELP